MTQDKLWPRCFRGLPQDAPVIPGYDWLTLLPRHRRIYLCLSTDWASLTDLPLGYDTYIVSYHSEAVNVSWVAEQAAKVSGHIIVLYDGCHYDLHIDHVSFIPYFYWHEACKKITAWFPESHQQWDQSHRFLSVCNRITQSKLLVTCQLLEKAPDDSLVVLSKWLEEKNVHGWQKTGSTLLDQITDVFVAKYLGTEIVWDGEFVNDARWTSDPWQEMVQRSALCFTNESFHYSYMLDHLGSYIYPGPFITEKTWKCLLGGKGIIAVGQFETYRTLEKLGLVFDYGLDLSYDLDPGNISRLEKLMHLIDHLTDMDMTQLYDSTKRSALYNQQWIKDGGFYKSCVAANEISIAKIFDLIT